MPESQELTDVFGYRSGLIRFLCRDVMLRRYVTPISRFWAVVYGTKTASS